MIAAGAVRWRPPRRDSRRAAGILLDERDHHVADAELRRRPGPRVSDLRQPLLPARHERVRSECVPAGKDAPRRGDLAELDMCTAWCLPLGFLVAIGVALVVWAAVHTNALRLRGAGNQRTPRARAATQECGRVERSSPSCVSPARSRASEAPARTATFAINSIRVGYARRATATPASSSQHLRATTRWRSCPLHC